MVQGKSHECEFSFESRFMELPRIRLLDVPKSLGKVIPHIGSRGDLCYIAEGTVVLDIFDPVGQTLACLKRAEEVLDSILAGDMLDDLEEEFFAHWGSENVCCLSDLSNENLGRQEAFVTTTAETMFVVVTDDQVRTMRKLTAIGWKTNWSPIPTYRVQTSAKPRPSLTDWPPKNVRDVLNWQGLLDQRCRKKIQQRIVEAARTSAESMVLLIESPLMTYGFSVTFNRKKIIGAAKKWIPTMSEIFACLIAPMHMARIDDGYIATRNNPGKKTLAGKKIALVGCGTIGGYMADMLVKAGAGTGGGNLTLVDPDTLYPQNIGRHRLGFSSLLKKKVLALRAELQYGAPGVEIRALPVTVQQANLSDIDLVIDATGEEALGHWIAQHSTKLKVPHLHIWIEGAGIAVRGLLTQGIMDGCFRCLTTYNRSGQYGSIKGSMPVVQAGQGCEGLYVPFPAHISVQAASLGVEMVLDWVNEIYEPALRTRVLSSQYELATPDCNLAQLKDCPACKC
jgi:molybdopterin/thiamine biosynthesis adenylyltransferase